MLMIENVIGALEKVYSSSNKTTNAIGNLWAVWFPSDSRLLKCSHDFRLWAATICENKTKTQTHTFYAVMFGRKKDRGGLKAKCKKYLKESKWKWQA